MSPSSPTITACRLVMILVVGLGGPGLRGQIRIIPGSAGTAPPRATGASPATISPVSSAQLVIGGPGTRGSGRAVDVAQPDDMPASGLIAFRYDAESGTLALRVTNTCPVVPGAAPSRITRILFNLPHGAVTGATLVGQTASGEAAPAFQLQTSQDPQDASRFGDPRSLGRFGAVLETATGFPGGITGAADPELAGAVLGPVNFMLALNGPHLRGLSASAFCGSFSVVDENRIPVNAALTFAGPEEARGTVSNAPVETAAAWYVGRPVPGGSLDFVLSGAPGSIGGILCSPSSGPTMIAGITVPLGLPALVAVEGILPRSALITRRIEIPPNPKLAGTVIHCVAVTVDPGMCGIALSNGFDLRIEAAKNTPRD